MKKEDEIKLIKIIKEFFDSEGKTMLRIEPEELMQISERRANYLIEKWDRRGFIIPRNDHDFWVKADHVKLLMDSLTEE